MKVNINIENLDEFKEQSKAVELAAEKLQEELDKLNDISIVITGQKKVTLEDRYLTLCNSRVRE